MTMQLISIGFGKESFTASSARLNAFVVKPPFYKVLPSNAFKRQGTVQRFPASQYPEINGYLYVDSVKDVPDGTFILLQMSQTYRGNPIRDGALFIRLRNTGPMLAVQAQLPSSQEALITGGFLAFQGRGDIMRPHELKDYGIEPDKRYLSAYTDDEEVAECFRIETTGEGTAEKPVFEKIETPDGEVVLVQARRRRKINARRQP